MAELVVREEFMVYGDVLEWVEVLIYLSCHMSMAKNDAHAVWVQLAKSQCVWLASERFYMEMMPCKRSAKCFIGR